MVVRREVCWVAVGVGVGTVVVGVGAVVAWRAHFRRQGREESEGKGFAWESAHAATCNMCFVVLDFVYAPNYLILSYLKN